MTKLSVNINKIATLRNARGGNVPDVVRAAVDCQQFGADGITVHPRPDGRHIRYRDVYEIKSVITTEFNIEGYPSNEFLKMVEEIKPHQVTLVPDPPDAITSNAGWDTVNHFGFLSETVSRLKAGGMRVSLFLETNSKLLEFAARTGTDRIELYTENYAKRFLPDRISAIAPYREAALLAKQLNLGLNAGHDLNLENLRYFHENIPYLLEVSIGHALISDALYFGLENTIRMYKRLLR